MAISKRGDTDRSIILLHLWLAIVYLTIDHPVSSQDPNHAAPVYAVPGTNFEIVITDSLQDREEMLSDFVKRCKGIIEVGLQWVPNLVRSHLANYMLDLQHPSSGLIQHTGLALATESVLTFAGFNRNASFLGVSFTGFLVINFRLFFDGILLLF